MSTVLLGIAAVLCPLSLVAVATLAYVYFKARFVDEVEVRNLRAVDGVLNERIQAVEELLRSEGRMATFKQAFGKK